jgi:hypothetical protein
MNYTKLYKELIHKAKERDMVDGYTEIHHIIPKSEGGSNDKDNLVVLTGREHFIAHKILWMETPTNYSRAATYHMMSNHRGIKWGATYEEVRKVFTGENHPLRQVKNRIKQLESVMGKPKSDEHRKKISEANKGKPKSKEHTANMKASLPSRVGSGNSMYGKGKPIIGDGVEYPNAKTAAIETGTTPQNIFYRLNHKKWNWHYKDLVVSE